MYPISHTLHFKVSVTMSVLEHDEINITVSDGKFLLVISYSPSPHLSFLYTAVSRLGTISQQWSETKVLLLILT